MKLNSSMGYWMSWNGADFRVIDRTLWAADGQDEERAWVFDPQNGVGSAQPILDGNGNPGVHGWICVREVP